MGTKDGKPLITPRLEAFEAALRLYQYPEAMWAWLTDGACLLMRLAHKIEEIDWYAELGKPFSAISPEDVS